MQDGVGSDFLRRHVALVERLRDLDLHHGQHERGGCLDFARMEEPCGHPVANDLADALVALLPVVGRVADGGA